MKYDKMNDLQLRTVNYKNSKERKDMLFNLIKGKKINLQRLTNLNIEIAEGHKEQKKRLSKKSDEMIKKEYKKAVLERDISFKDYQDLKEKFKRKKTKNSKILQNKKAILDSKEKKYFEIMNEALRREDQQKIDYFKKVIKSIPKFNPLTIISSTKNIFTPSKKFSTLDGTPLDHPPFDYTLGFLNNLYDAKKEKKSVISIIVKNGIKDYLDEGKEVLNNVKNFFPKQKEPQKKIQINSKIPNKILGSSASKKKIKKEKNNKVL